MTHRALTSVLFLALFSGCAPGVVAERPASSPSPLVAEAARSVETSAVPHDVDGLETPSAALAKNGGSAAKVASQESALPDPGPSPSEAPQASRRVESGSVGGFFDLPPGWEMQQMTPTSLWVDSGHRARAGVIIVPASLDASSAKEVYAGFTEGFRSELPQLELRVVEDLAKARRKTPWFERVLAIGDEGAGARLVLVPACRGAATYLFTMVWTDAQGKAEAEQVFDSFRRTEDEMPPGCSATEP